jgi:hypothetical protein
MTDANVNDANAVTAGAIPCTQTDNAAGGQHAYFLVTLAICRNRLYGTGKRCSGCTLETIVTAGSASAAGLFSPVSR